MRQNPSALVSALVLLLAFSPSLAAQTLKEGLWDGSMTIPGESEIQVQYRVTKPAGKLNITIEGERNQLPVHSVQLEKDTLSFSWGNAPTTDCRLKLQDDGSYIGGCSRGGGSQGRMKMTPPARDQK